MYKELILRLTKENEWVKLQPPCPEKEIREAEKVVGYPLPEELKKLMLECDGDRYFLLSAKEMIENVERNRKFFYPLFKEDYSIEAYRDRVDRFIFFATNGCGDYYGYRVSENGTAEENAIYIWEHEALGDDCCWKKVADSLEECITRYYHSEI